MNNRLFEELNEKEEKRLKWLVGFYMSQNIVRPTFSNRPNWDKDRIVEELQNKYFDLAYNKFYSWVKEKSEQAIWWNDFKGNREDSDRDINIFFMMKNSKQFNEKIKEFSLKKIKEIAKEIDLERQGCKSKYTGFLDSGEWEKVLDKFNRQCAYCAADEDLTKDHITPTSKGGKDEINNIVPACKSCNSSKNDIALHEWYPYRNYFTDERYQKILEHIREGEQQ